MNIYTYHYSDFEVSKIISKYSEKAGQWNIAHVIKELRNVAAPSHVLLEAQGRYFEADWGEQVLPFFPFWRKKGGVREISKIELLARSGIHIRWSLSSKHTIEKSTEAEVLFFCLKSIKLKIKYDFRGLMSAAKKTWHEVAGISGKKYSENPKKYFCSEFVATILNQILKMNRISSGFMTPAMIPSVFSLEYSGILK